VFANHGIEVQGYVHDTMLQSYVLEVHKPHGLASLAERHLGRSGISYEDLCGKGAHQIPFAQVDVAKAASTPARTPTRRWTCTGALAPAAGRRQAARSSTSWKSPAARRCTASSATAC
jgi:DNA polymerase-1